MKKHFSFFVITFCFLAITGILSARDVIAPMNDYQIKKATSEKFPNYSGDNQYQVIHKNLKSPCRVVVVNEHNQPVEGVPVNFEVINTPKGATGSHLDKDFVKTDSNGVAENSFVLGSKEGEYEIAASIKSSSSHNFQIFIANARKSNWVFMVIIGLFGGLGLFLFGMNMMSEGLQKSAGDKMRTILSKLTYNRLIALSVGTFVTMVIQSSSATTVMLVSFVNSKLMRFKQTIGIILGAAIGTTITAQIIAFKLTDYSLLLIGIGFLLYLIPKKPVYKNVGEAILGFGILFFGMQVMSEAMYPLRSYEPFINILLQLENPLLGILVGAMLTALIQSSSAFIGIMIILGTQGFLTLEASIPLLIGANLGTAITAILASISANREAKQVALAHTLFKVAGALILVWWIPQFVRLIEWVSFVEPHQGLDASGYLPREIANAHTVYNVILTILFLPFTDIYARFINFLLPYKEEKEFLPVTKYLDESMLKTPSLALNLAKQEVLHMISIVRKMAVNIIIPFMEKRTDVIPLIDQYNIEVNFLRDEINDYILQITRQTIDKERAEEAFQLLYAVNEFEQIADIISSNLKSKAISWSSNVYEFSTRGKNEIMNYHIATLKQIDRAYELYQDFSLSKALKMKEKYEKFREMSFALEKQHYNRLTAEEEKTINSSKTHLELMTMLKLIGSHATNTARILIKNSM